MYVQHWVVAWTSLAIHQLCVLMHMHIQLYTHIYHGHLMQDVRVHIYVF